MNKKHPESELSAEDCRWRCPTDSLRFETTAEVTADPRILGQDEAVSALRFGLKNRYKGDNVFVRGLSGFGRMALIDQTINDLATGTITVPDRCFVHNFSTPDQPRLVELPIGHGKEFRQLMEDFAEFARSELPAYLSSEIVTSKQKQLVTGIQQEIQQLRAPLDEELQAAELALVSVQVGQNVVPMIVPVIEGAAVSFEDLQKRRMAQQISEDEFKALLAKIESFSDRLNQFGEQLSVLQHQQQSQLVQLMTAEAGAYIARQTDQVRARFPQPEVESFLVEVTDDLVKRQFMPEPGDFLRLYQVNLVSTHGVNERLPVISVSNPTLVNLVGSVNTEIVSGTGLSRSDHLMINPGALLQADGGFLIVEAREIVSEPGAWMALLRTLKTGQLELNSFDGTGMWPAPRLKPAPIPVDIKVILVGDPETYYMLDQLEPRFASLFKVLADFGDTIARDETGFATYTNMIARLVQRDNLLPFDQSAVARLIEQGARICAQHDRLTSRFGRIADIAREAAFLSAESDQQVVSAEQVELAIRRSRDRADLPARRFRRQIANGGILIDVEGEQAGQINGLAVTSAGTLIYGFPSRITATVGAGNAGMVNIERESDLSGAIHTKGFMILGGLFRHLLRLDHPMAFSSSIAFEQSYGGIDGDSASAAEFVCLMSALTEAPVRQDLAMTGAVDQKGNILPIGGVTEKVEGFYDACRSVNFTGTQGVIVPATNSRELMLRQDVVDAIAAGQFHVYHISRIEEALTLFTGREFGDADNPDEGTLLHEARKRAHRHWQAAIAKQ